ncbi:MAG TPA: DEAD/DEAH box helicase, partial [Nannocystaceae bacterium]|nr:DEAD/DEAH box helicase [Nannocystaceae bacterium]
MLDALRGRDLARAYTHQARALEATLTGRDVVLATGTASGKSLCFQLPILQSVLEDPSARALLLFPTKALARDQCESLRTLAAALPDTTRIGVGPYDGDTPPDERRAAKARAHAVATNPDMLHRGILPFHEQWGRFLAGLRLVVLDELHMYRGLFGSHVANVLRRLWRVCAHYGSTPRVVACSATIANPVALAEALTGRTGFVGVDEDQSPAGPRTFLVLNPKVVDATVGVRRDYLKVTRVVASEIRRAHVQSLVFCRTRKAVELLTRYLQDDERKDGDRGDASTASASIRGYRGGYLPERRREVERALRAGEARLVATTHALELGIDIGGVDVVVLSGYPGSRAATLQRA